MTCITIILFWALLGIQSNYLGHNYKRVKILKKTQRVRLDRWQEHGSMKQADHQCHWPTPWMQENDSMHKKPYSWHPVRHSCMNQARSEEEEKERKQDRKDRGQEANGKKGSPTKQKPIWGTKTRPTWAQLRLKLEMHQYQKRGRYRYSYLLGGPCRYWYLYW